MTARSNQGSGDRAFRVVKKDTGHLQFFGPYSKLNGARDKMRVLTEPYFAGLPSHLEIWIEQTPSGWEKVEAA